LKLAAGKTPRNPACGFVDNSLAKTRQRTGALAVDKSQKTATYPPRSPLTTSSTGASRFDSKCKGQNQKFRLIPLLELTDHNIWVESALNVGSTFHFTIRLPLTDQAPTDPALHAGKRLEEKNLLRLRGADILLVEDTELNQEVLRDLLEQSGLRVRLASNGEEALREVAAARPDCVLMDCQMPVMDGYEASRHLRQDPQLQDLPIVALTANAMASDRERCLNAGMNDYVTKPVKRNELLAALARWVAEKPAVANDVANPSDPPSTAAQQPSQISLPALRGIDIQAGLNQVAGSQDLYLKILRKFRDQHVACFESDFRQARSAGNDEAVLRLAHTLKGVARMVGAFRLGDLAASLEQAAREGNHTAFDAHLADVLDELARLMQSLDTLDMPAPPQQGIRE
jgi:CheY-like chemotaxis protein/HPt (histidine-containing phosphotransfer) domain-containing protein